MLSGPKNEKNIAVIPIAIFPPTDFDSSGFIPSIYKNENINPVRNQMIRKIIDKNYNIVTCLKFFCSNFNKSSPILSID